MTISSTEEVSTSRSSTTEEIQKGEGVKAIVQEKSRLEDSLTEVSSKLQYLFQNIDADETREWIDSMSNVVEHFSELIDGRIGRIHEGVLHRQEEKGRGADWSTDKASYASDQEKTSEYDIGVSFDSQAMKMVQEIANMLGGVTIDEAIGRSIGTNHFLLERFKEGQRVLVKVNKRQVRELRIS